MKEMDRRPADIAWLQQHLDERRFVHSLGTEAAARMLALRFGQDPERAALAGRLHDCAKKLPNEALVARYCAAGLPTDDILLHSPQLLHAPVGALVAQEELHVHDPQVLSAIRWHTVPRRDMAPLDMVVSVADLIEPSRSFPGVDALRKIAERNLIEAFIESLAYVMRHVLERGRLLHPDTVWVYNTMKLAQLNRKGKEPGTLGANN